MTHDDVQKLAELSRIEIQESDIPAYLNDFENILGYIDTIQSVEGIESTRADVVKNVVRTDDMAYTAGEFSDDILAQAPETDAGFIRVQKIL